MVLDTFFRSIYKFYYDAENPLLKFLFFFIALAFYILNIALYVVSFGTIASMYSISTGAYKIFGILLPGYIPSDMGYAQRRIVDMTQYQNPRQN